MSSEMRIRKNDTLRSTFLVTKIQIEISDKNISLKWMQVITRLKRCFYEFGGWRLIWEYTRLGIFIDVICQGWLIITGKEDIATGYSMIQKKVVPKIRY